MKIVIQRVTKAKVVIEEKVQSEIKNGLLLFLGIEHSDTETDANWLCKKVVNMRIFSDAAGLMNLSVKDIGGELLLVSQFTLLANAKKGNRPSFIQAARPEQAIPLYELMIQQLNIELGKEIKTGVFGADMQIEIINDGPVTILLDTKN